MQNAGSLLSEDEPGGGSSTASYRDLASDQLTQAVLDGGGLGLASMLYGQINESLGLAAGAGDDAAEPAAPAEEPQP
jgi:Rod binding domain-containing protein